MYHGDSPTHLARQFHRLIVPLLLAVIVLLWPISAFAATITVTGACTLPDAITAANTDAVAGSCTAGSGDDVLNLSDPLYALAAGPFAADGNNATPSITSKIVINGGGAIIERSGLGIYRLFHVAANGDLTLNSVTVRNGEELEGGAIYNLGTLTVTNSTLVTNTATWGGALANYNGAEAHIDMTFIITNTAAADGGGIYNYNGSTVFITDTDVSWNVASGVGGGVVNDTASRYISEDYVLRDNAAGSHGGAIYNVNGSLTELNGGTIRENTGTNGGAIFNGITSTVTISNTGAFTNSASGNGGLVYNWSGSTLAITRSLVLQNDAANGGAIYNETDSAATVFDTEVYSNSATTSGGAIYNNNRGAVQVAESSVRGNNATNGGGILSNDHSSLSIDQSEVKFNIASGTGGGVFNQATSAVTVTNSALLTNTAAEGGALYNNDVATATLTNTAVEHNVATFGGGIANYRSSRLTFTDVRLNDNSASGGGGLYNWSGSIFIATSSEIALNRATDSGGGITNEDGSGSFITDTLVLSNTATNNGGGVYNLGKLVAFSDGEIRNNQSGGKGGGLYSDDTVTVQGTLVTHNDAPQGGGLYIILFGAIMGDARIISNTATTGAGLYLDQTIAIIQEATVAENVATGDGGGIYVKNGLLAAWGADVFTNTATVGGGIHLDKGQAQFIDSRVGANEAGIWGGGLFMTNQSQSQLNGVTVSGNRALQDGGGIFNTGVSTSTVTTSTVFGNVAAVLGGGIANSVDSVLTLVESQVVSNTATAAAGIYQDGRRVTLDNTDVMSNTAQGNGGGVYNVTLTEILTGSVIAANQALNGGAGGGVVNDSGTLWLTSATLSGNTATSLGGGLLSTNSSDTIIDATRVELNSAPTGGGIQATNSALVTATASIISSNGAASGGGLHNTASAVTTLADSVINGNGVSLDGGGIYNDSVITLTATNLISNTAGDEGGALYMAAGQAYIDGAQILENQAVTQGGAVQQADGVTGISASCIVNNSDVAVNYGAGNDIEATGNWWGAPDGPSGAGSGAGDSVSANVLFDPFVTTQPVDCPARTATLAFSKAASISGDALPGQPLDFTLFVTNTGASQVKAVYVNDVLPVQYTLNNTLVSGPGISFNGSSYVIATIDAAQSVTITFEGEVEATLDADTTLLNTATLTHALQTTLTAAAAVDVVVPVVAWSQANYAADEDSGSFGATVLLTPANPYATVTVQAVYTDSTEGGLVALASETVTFIPGDTSETVDVAIADDNVVLARTIQLRLQTPSGAALGNPAAATLTLTEDDAQAALAVTKVANTGAAVVGDTITYTYRITNTGNVTMTTITATDDQLGAVAGLAGELAPNATRSATLTYVVLQSDLPGPLVNTVTVTGTATLGGPATGSAQASVTISAPTNLPEGEQPEASGVQLWLPGIKSE